MMTEMLTSRLQSLWESLYQHNNNYEESLPLLSQFISQIEDTREAISRHKSKQPQHAEDEPKDELFHVKSEDWYQKAVIYCLYVDLFNGDFAGLEEKLVYLQQLGVTTLWLLPILDSPMKDCGFDIRDYNKIRKELLPENIRDSSTDDQFAFFRRFMSKAHALGINVLIDVALNHTSEENEWFVKEKALKADGAAIDSENDFYIWSECNDKYDQVRIIFSDVCDSNWERITGEGTDNPRYYFHRFLANQPDLNYKNPLVLLHIASVFVFWLRQGVDAFRMDAIPMLWKQEGTECESLPQVHTVLKFFRSVIDYVSPHTMILAEACQQPRQVVQYFGENDECHAAYHFPLIPRLFHAMAIQDKAPVQQILSPLVTPEIPSHCSWFLFLRCHDELTLEMVPESERREIFNFYCRNEKWQFRQHSGVSARLADLCNLNSDWIKMAHSLLLTIIGTPILFYGDEFAMQNDDDYYEEALLVSGGIHDTRNYNRGRLNTRWEMFEEEINKESSLSAIVHNDLKKKLQVRKQFEWLGKTCAVNVLDCKNKEGNVVNNILAYERTSGDEGLVVVHNLSDRECDVVLPYPVASEKDLLDQDLQVENGMLRLKGYGHVWLRLSHDSELDRNTL
jgi:maltose alpha-D-glucosyltransferase/alpha-amylase